MNARPLLSIAIAVALLLATAAAASRTGHHPESAHVPAQSAIGFLL